MQAIAMILLSLCMTAVCAPARADLFRDTLSICSSRLDNRLAYQQALEDVGWIEVMGSQGATVIDRTNWLQIPMVRRSEIDPNRAQGLVCRGHDLCFYARLGQSDWAPKAQTQAFTNGESALLMYSRMSDHQNSETYQTDYLSCQMISPDMAPHAQLRDAVSETKLLPVDRVRTGSSEFGPLFELKDFQQTQTGFWLEDYSGDGLRYDGILPWTSLYRTIYLTDPKIMADLGFENLRYTQGFSTEIKHHYEGASP
jgi:hypothetical protein